MAALTDSQREKLRREVEKAEQQRFAEWKQLQEQLGYRVDGDSFATAQVVELADGPTFDERPGA